MWSFRSRDKNGGHTSGSAIAENPMLCADFTVLCFIERELLLIEFLHCGDRDFQPFCSCDLELDPMTSYTNLTRIPSRCTGGPKVNFLRQSFASCRITERQTDRQTDIHTPPKLYTTPLRGWPVSEQKILFCFVGVNLTMYKR